MSLTGPARLIIGKEREPVVGKRTGTGIIMRDLKEIRIVWVEISCVGFP